VRPHEYLLVLVRNWLVIVATVAIGLAAGLGITFAMHKEYGASAQVLITGQATTNGQDLAYVGSYTQSRLTTYQRLAESTSILTLVKHDLGTRETVPELRSRVDLSTVQGTTIITIRTTDKTPVGAVKTAQIVAARLTQAVETVENSAGVKSNATVKATIIGKAELQPALTSPKLPLNLLIGALVGLLVSVGVITVREALRAGRDGAAKLT
jgi:succinoglycan biosynthesis transport protein ExoP